MGIPRVRRRVPEDAIYDLATGLNYGTPYTTEFKFIPWETTEDELHDWDWWRSKENRAFLKAQYGSSKIPWDLGGPFYSEKFLLRNVEPAFWNGTFLGPSNYDGPLYPVGPVVDGRQSSSWGTYWSRPKPTDVTFLSGLGGTAISRCKPTNPHASVAQSLVELKRDGLPSVPLASLRKKGLSGLPEEHLNYEFGLRPLLADIKSVRTAMMDAKAILEQYARDSGRLVRRKYSFPVSTQTTRTVDPRSSFGFTAYAYQQPWATLTKVVKTETSYQFSGAFTYQAITDTDDRISWLGNKIQEANHLLGLAPTPSLFWDTLPYSWFVDWFTNIGDIVSNVTSIMTDGLVVNWGYLTEVISIETEFDKRGSVMNDGSRPIAKMTFKYESKRRIRATPYGFGFDMQTLSARQFAILASLGLTRGGRWVAM